MPFLSSLQAGEVVPDESGPEMVRQDLPVPPPPMTQDLGLGVDHLGERFIGPPHEEAVWGHWINVSNVSRYIAQWLDIDDGLDFQEHSKKHLFGDWLRPYTSVKRRLD